MYVPLYIKTENSLLNSLIKIDDLINKAKSLNFSALTITDNNMYGVMYFYHKCIENNIKPIIGLEVIIDNNIFVLYCKNYQGYKNLMKITTSISDNTISYDFLKKYNTNLICILPYKYLKIYDQIKEIYDEFYISYESLEERKNIKYDNLIYMKETVYLEKNDVNYYSYLLGIKDGIILPKVINNKKSNYLYSFEEIKDLYSNDLENNYKVCDECNLEIKFNQDLLPKYKIDNNMTVYDYLKKLCVDGLKKIFGSNVSLKYIERLKYELDIINKMGFCNYFLIVYDYVKYARENGILVGPGRGSAAGSLVSYCLNITTIDPLKYNLLFERFLNPERVSMPDIDIDFEFDRREEVIDYCRNLYGKKSVAPIITFGTLGSKQVIRDVGRVMDIDLNVVDKLSKMIDSNLNLVENYKKNIELVKLLKSNKELFNLYKISSKLEGLKRHKTIHAAGIVMANVELDEVIPLDYHQNEFYLTGYSMDYLEKIGLLKMDFLALKNLSTINEIIKNIGDDKLNFENIPLNDSKTIDIFKNGYTLGIFQFESNGMIEFLKSLKPTSFNDLIDAVALYRPGPMKNIDSYIKRKNGLEKIDYIHKDLEEILKPTYGIIIYQEQIMQIASKLALFSLGEADILRKAMSKKNKEVMLSMKEKFVNQSLEKGYSIDIINKVYDFILKFAEYGFNKAHSVSYVVISMRMAYLKANYKYIFMKTLLSNNIGSIPKTKSLIYECKQMNIELKLPDINLSNSDYEIVNNSLIYPMSGIKNIGKILSTIIVSNRGEKYIDIFDFVAKNYGKIDLETIKQLNHAGCFINLGINRHEVDLNLHLIYNYGEIGNLVSDDSLKPIITHIEEYSNFEIMNFEQEVYGFYLSKHPVTEYKASYNTIDLINVKNYFNKFVDIIVLVDRVNKIVTKDNKEMMFVTGSDEETNLDIVFFPKAINLEVNVGDILKIYGRIERRFDKYQIIVRSYEKLNR